LNPAPPIPEFIPLMLLAGAAPDPGIETLSSAEYLSFAE